MFCLSSVTVVVGVGVLSLSDEQANSIDKMINERILIFFIVIYLND
jgi:hypothetical protein